MSRPSLYKVLAFPATIWFLIFLTLPVALVIILSFATRGPYGNVEWIFQWKNYGSVFQEAYLGIALKSFLMASGTALTCLILGFCIAWALSTASLKKRNFWLIILMLPFLTNLVIRIYATKLFVGIDGPLQSLLTAMGLRFDPFYFTANPYLVFYGLTASYLPFAVFPIYAAFEKFDFDLVEAAKDLGADAGLIIFKILIPILKMPLISGFSLVFIPCLGEYVIPDLLGGAKQMLLGNLIVESFLRSRNWPLGAALSVCVFSVVAMLFLIMNLFKRSPGESKSA